MQVPSRLDRSEMSVLKVDYKVKSAFKAVKKVEYLMNHKKQKDHADYRNPETLLFDRDREGVNGEDFIQRNGFRDEKDAKKGGKFPLLYEMIISVPDEFYESERHYQQSVRKTMLELEKRKGIKLDWIASVHGREGKSHAHILVRSLGELPNPRDDEKTTRYLTIKKDDVYWTRNEFKKHMGLKWVKENYVENEVRISEQLKQNKEEWKEFKEFVAERRKQRAVSKSIKHVAKAIDSGRGGKERRDGSKFWGLFADGIKEKKPEKLVEDSRGR